MTAAMSMVDIQEVMERYLRSVFVRNVSKDATDEELKIIFNGIGSVLNFRHFPDSTPAGRTGFVFCEYADQETALRAIHMLRDFDFKGQALNIDIAASDQSRQELERLHSSIVEANEVVPNTENPEEKAPEEISKAVASLPAEQMFELMKQMKMCIENNPQEARNLLIQNPQLAYALLQAQVIMRIVDPEVAMKILNRPPSLTEELGNKEDAAANNPGFSAAASQPPNTAVPVTAPETGTSAIEASKRPTDPRFRGLPSDPRTVPVQNPRTAPVQDPRTVVAQDPRTVPVQDPRVMPGMDPRMLPVQDPRVMDPRLLLAQMDPRALQDPRVMQMMQDPRMMQSLMQQRPVAVDPRVAAKNLGVPGPALAGARMPSGMPATLPGMPAAPAANIFSQLSGIDDQEKTTLIMQVLQLTDEQIAALPPDQQQSILLLKQQIAQNQIVL